MSQEVTQRKTNGASHTNGNSNGVKQQNSSQKNGSSEMSALERRHKKLCEFLDYATYNFPPNIKTLKLKHFANFQKALMMPFMLTLMWYYNNFSLGCWVHMALHGTYGLLWNIKTLAFPDPAHEQRVSIGSLPQLFIVLGGYTYIPIMMASGLSDQNPSNERIFFSTLCLALGGSIMMVSDAQKYFILKVKKGLINYGMFRHCRNPNYCGEMMIYGSFAMLSNRVIPWLIVSFVWLFIFPFFWYSKELSFRRKEGWEEYKKASYMLVFKLYGSDVLSFLVYGFGLVFGLYAYSNGGMEATYNLWRA